RVPRETRRGRAGPDEPEHGGVDSRAPARDRAAPRGPRQARGGPGAAEGARPPHRAPRREEVNRAVSGHPDHRRGPRRPPPSLPQDRLRGRSPRSKGDQSHGHPPIGPAPRTPREGNGGRGNGATAPLVSGHPPIGPAPRTPLHGRGRFSLSTTTRTFRVTVAGSAGPAQIGRAHV